jgi:pantetheine-phosphate adenylyltransferase
MKRVVYSGTFDPITRGHINIIERGLTFFDTVVLAIAESKEKNPLFTIEERMEIARVSTKNLGSVEIVSFSGLLVDFLKERDIRFVIRGLRNGVDFEYERDMHYANKSLYKDIETIYLNSKLEDSFVSSSVVRTILKFGGDVSHLLPAESLELIKKKKERD